MDRNYIYSQFNALIGIFSLFYTVTLEYISRKSWKDIVTDTKNVCSIALRFSNVFLKEQWNRVFFYPTHIGRINKVQIFEYQHDGKIYQLFNRYDKKLVSKMLNSTIEYITETNEKNENRDNISNINRKRIILQPGIVPNFTASDIGDGYIEVTNLLDGNVSVFRNDETVTF